MPSIEASSSTTNREGWAPVFTTPSASPADGRHRLAMGKRKRSKHKPLTQEEIWDDSALIQSWDEAVQEYEFYHSIHAKGENIEDVLRDAEAGESAADTDCVYEEEDTSPLVSYVDGDAQQDGGELDEKQLRGIRKTGGSHITKATVAATTAPRGQGTAEAASSKMETKHPGGEFANMPQMVLEGGDTSGEQLKNLMMAWYFAGYYTGLYEGQQRGNQAH